MNRTIHICCNDKFEMMHIYITFLFMFYSYFTSRCTFSLNLFDLSSKSRHDCFFILFSNSFLDYTSLIYLFIYLFIYSFIYSFIYLFIHLFIYLFVCFVIYSFTYYSFFIFCFLLFQIDSSRCQQIGEINKYEYS